MAWLANPFAYIGINTLIAVMPGIARRLELSTMLAGFWGSALVFCQIGDFCRSLALARLALSFSLAAGRLSRPGMRLHHDSARPQPAGVGRRANGLRRSGRPDLLLLAVLLDGHAARPKASTAASTNRPLAWATAPARQ